MRGRYFANIKYLFGKIEGIDTLMEDPEVTSIRLVTVDVHLACPTYGENVGAYIVALGV